MNLKVKRFIVFFFMRALFIAGAIALGVVALNDVVIKCSNNTERISVLIFGIVFYIPLYLFLVMNPITSALNKSIYRSSPEFSVPAKVVSKLAQASGGRYSTNTFLVAFEFADGTRKNFNVNMTLFNLIAEDDVGTLTYREQGSLLFFVNFQAQK